MKADLIDDELVEAFCVAFYGPAWNQPPSKHGRAAREDFRKSTHVALAAVLTEPRVLRMAGKAVETHHARGGYVHEVLIGLADRLEVEKEQSRG